jgi:endonuclease/exonuclease/phosphatase family metal-dependent hydrolase
MQVSILQWNVWYKENIYNVAKFLLEHPADIICLQELTIQDIPETGHTPDYIAKQLGYHHFYKEIDLGEGKIPVANGIFSRHPIIDTNWVWINAATGTGHYDDEYRAYLEATVDIDGNKLTIGTTHMSYTNAFISTSRKEQEAKKLMSILNTKKQAFVFTGDLNAPPGSPTINNISKRLVNVGPDYTKKTWTTKPFSYDGFEETQLNWRLDYIFATRDIKTVSAEVLNTEYSDHLPVKAEIRLG